MSADRRVVIVGAGPAGASLATRLAEAGAHVVLLDRARFPRSKPCAEYLNPDTLRHLHLLGVLDGLLVHGYALAGTAVTGPNGARLVGHFRETSRPPFHPTGLALSRTMLDQALVERASAAGATVREDTRVEDLIIDDGHVAGVRMRTGDGVVESLRGALVVGADGLRSVVARRLGVVRKTGPGRMAFVGHMDGVRGLDAITTMSVGSRGYVGLNPLGEHLANVAVVVPAARARAAAGNRTSFFLEELGSYTHLQKHLDGAQLVGPVTATGPFASRARRVTANGALLVGDAADFFDPFTGEGVGTALRGAALAAGPILDALQAGGTITARRLAAYPRARRQAFGGKWAVERLVGFGMLTPWLFDRAVARLDRRGLADTFLGVTGSFLPARAVLNPVFLARMLF